MVGPRSFVGIRVELGLDKSHKGGDSCKEQSLQKSGWCRDPRRASHVLFHVLLPLVYTPHRCQAKDLRSQLVEVHPQCLSDTLLGQYRGEYRAFVLRTAEGRFSGEFVGLLSSLMA